MADALAIAVETFVELAVVNSADAVEQLRTALAHDWTDAIPPHVRDEYEHRWAQAFVDTVTRLAPAAEPSLAAEPLTN